MNSYQTISNVVHGRRFTGEVSLEKQKNQKEQVVFAISGYKNSGKTTLTVNSVPFPSSLST